MPAYYYWISKETGEKESLETIDDEICAVIGVEPDPERFSPEFEFFNMALAHRGWSPDEWLTEYTGNSMRTPIWSKSTPKWLDVIEKVRDHLNSKYEGHSYHSRVK